MKPDFRKPLVTYMLSGGLGEKLTEETANAIKRGADAIGFQLESLSPRLVEPGFIREVIAAAGEKPVYVTNYRRGNPTPSKTDDDLARELLMALDLGASIIDIPAHMFSDSEIEVSFDVAAVKRQKDFIGEIKKRGGTALMSSHMFRFMPREEVYELAKTHKSRGADITKIVTNADSESELTENLVISAELGEKVGIPYLFLCNGSFCGRHRMLSAALGSCMLLCSTDEQPQNPQPNLGMAKELLELIEHHRAGLGEIQLKKENQ